MHSDGTSVRPQLKGISTQLCLQAHNLHNKRAAKRDPRIIFIFVLFWGGGINGILFSPETLSPRAPPTQLHLHDRGVSVRAGDLSSVCKEQSKGHIQALQMSHVRVGVWISAAQ